MWVNSVYLKGRESKLIWLESKDSFSHIWKIYSKSIKYQFLISISIVRKKKFYQKKWKFWNDNLLVCLYNNYKNSFLIKTRKIL
jgi:hypothetical protein